MPRKPVDPFKPNPRHGNGYVSNYATYKEVVTKPMLPTPESAMVPDTLPTLSPIRSRVWVVSTPETTYVSTMIGKVLRIL
jgi:hypothetical protein